MKVILHDWQRFNSNYDLDEKILSLNLQKGDLITHLVEGNPVSYRISFKEAALHEDSIIFHCCKD